MLKETLGINSRKVICPGPTQIALRALPQMQTDVAGASSMIKFQNII